MFGRREMPGSIPGRSCRPSRSEFTEVFSETCVNVGEDFLDRLPVEGTPPPLRPRSHMGTIDLKFTTSTRLNFMLTYSNSIVYFSLNQKCILFFNIFTFLTREILFPLHEKWRGKRFTFPSASGFEAHRATVLEMIASIFDKSLEIHFSM